MTPAQCRAARGLLNWTQDDLGAAARVSAVRVRNFENEKTAPQRASLDVMRRALEAAGVEFTESGPPGVRVRSFNYRLDAIVERIGDPAWATSGPERLLWVHAETPDMARALAAEATFDGSSHLPGTFGQTPPWKNETLTACVWDQGKRDVPYGAVVTKNGVRLDDG